MKPFDPCPICGGDLESKQVEKLLRGSGNTVSMQVVAEVCSHCGERLYAEDLHLPESERAELVQSLLLSLDSPSEEEISDDWLLESKS